MTFYAIDHERRHYVLESPAGYSCLGFDVAEHRRAAYAAWLDHGDAWRDHPADASPAPLGTVEHYREYAFMLSSVLARCKEQRTRCPVELEQVLKGWEGCRVEVITRDDRRRFWVGRSTGPVPIHIEISRRNYTGGPAVYIPDGATVKVVKLPNHSTTARVGDMRVK